MPAGRAPLRTGLARRGITDEVFQGLGFVAVDDWVFGIVVIAGGFFGVF
ncbi:hypothetical protein AAFP30_23480 [Gordonia sp. CPCC 205515]